MSDPVLEASRAVIERGSRSFAAASQLLPPGQRDGAHLLYTWCRHCDDRIDRQQLGFAVPASPESPEAVLDVLVEQTSRALQGKAVSELPFKALQRVAAEYALPNAYPLAHLEGFAMDTRRTRYDVPDDTIRYSYHVAGVVGLMMAWIMGVRDEDTLDRAADLGIAFQLTNIARDVIDDARVGRVYLPENWLREEGLDHTSLADPKNRSSVARVVARVLALAEQYYASANVGIARLPTRAAWSIATARYVYRDIGTLIRLRGARAWDERVVVEPIRKLGWVLAAGADALFKSVSSGPVVTRSGLWPLPRYVRD